MGSKVAEVTDNGVKVVGAKMEAAAPTLGRYIQLFNERHVQLGWSLPKLVISIRSVYSFQKSGRLVRPAVIL